MCSILIEKRRPDFEGTTVKKGEDKVAALFLSPASDKGRSTLRLGDNMGLYIPNVGKPVRITSLQSVVGGIFNNSDIMRLDYADEYNVEKKEHTFRISRGLFHPGSPPGQTAKAIGCPSGRTGINLSIHGIAVENADGLGERPTP